MREINYNETVEFLSSFFKFTEHPVELRAFRNAGGAAASIFTRDPDDVVEYCRQHDVPGWGVYFGIATRTGNPRGGGREFLRELIAVWAEIDIHKFGMLAEQAIAILLSCPLPPSLIVSSGRGLHVYWLLKEPLSVTLAPFGDDLEKARVEVVTRGLARIFRGDPNACDITRVLRPPGTHHTKQDQYSVPGSGPLLVRVLEASWARYEFEEVEAFAAECRSLIEAPEAIAGATPVPSNAANKGDAEDDPFLDYASAMAMDIEAELAAMRLHDEAKPVHAIRVRAAASLVARGHSDEIIFERLIAATREKIIEAGEVWNAAREREETRKLRSEIRSAHAKGWAPKADKVVQLRPGQSARPEAATEPEITTAPEFMGFPLNDLGNAARMIQMHAPQMATAGLLYVVGIGWHVWDGKRYRYDPEGLDCRLLANKTAQEMLRQARAISLSSGASKVDKKNHEAIFKFAAGAGNSARLDAMVKEVRTYRKMSSDDFDRQSMLLNCRNGTLDLESGKLLPHRQADRLAKLAGAEFDPEATCPIWEKFISEIFEGKQEIIDFVQRMIGYTLTGETKEEVVLILYGLGANGKSVLIETIAGVMGEYATHASAETWMVRHNDHAPRNDLAGLAGARFVPVTETEHGKQLAEAMLKQASSGDIMKVRFLYREEFEFKPKFKLWLATNHRPKIQGDYAIWRRLLLLPFNVTFADADKKTLSQKLKDPDLKVNLTREYPGILAWMVRGCQAWIARGLCPPKAVVKATEEYEASQNSVAGFVNDNCDVQKSIQCEGGLLLASYNLWCEDHDVSEPFSDKAFYARLTAMGYANKRTNKVRYREGIDLKGDKRTEAKQRMAEKAAEAGAGG